MKRLFLFLFLTLLMSQNAFAQKAWTVETVPNTRLQSNYIHVSDPDNFLSADAEDAINRVLASVADSADVFLVALGSIGNDDPTAFRTSLFNRWGIGDKKKNNGMLLLFVEDQHAMEFETGYGIEPLIPDIECFQIFNKVIKPYFKEGDYQGGLCAGVCAIAVKFGAVIPEGLMENLGVEERVVNYDEDNESEGDATDNMSNFFMWTLFFLCVGIPIVSVWYYASDKKKKKNNPDEEAKDTYVIEERDGVKYIKDPSSSWTGSVWQGKGCLRSLTFGFSGLLWLFVCSVLLMTLLESDDATYVNNWIGATSIFAYLTWICWRQNRRTLKMADKLAKDSVNPKKIYEIAENYRRTKFVNYCAPWLGLIYMTRYTMRRDACPELRCPTCGGDMHEVEGFKPNDIQACELKLETRKYVSARCQQGHEFVLVDKGKEYSKFIECTVCHGFTMKKTGTKTIESPTYSAEGVDEVTYVCQYCNATHKIRVKTPKLVDTSSSDSSSSSYSSSSSDSGSFGGGSSGGGGYSGRW